MIGVGAIAGNSFDLGAHGIFITKNTHRVHAILKLPTQCILGLKANQENGVFGMADVIFEMM